MKLYYGGFGDHQDFTVAEDEQDAIDKIGKKISAPFLPITVKEISTVDGFNIHAYKTEAIPQKVEITESTTETVVSAETVEDESKTEVNLRHCKKCDFSCESQGQLLAHYREMHPKGD